MPSYPNFDQEAESRVSWPGTVITERTSNGTLRARELAPEKPEFEVVHCLTLEESDALLAWYASNKGEDVDFVWSEDGQTYTVVCLERPAIERAGPALRVVTVKLMGA